MIEIGAVEKETYIAFPRHTHLMYPQQKYILLYMVQKYLYLIQANMNASRFFPK